LQKKILRKRNTPTKSGILNILKRENRALAHKDFQEFLGDSVDRVTIYRALDRLTEEGEIHKITGVEGVVQYALCVNCNSNHDHRHDHIHFHCTRCKRVICIENVAPQFSLPQGYQVSETQFMVTGICAECSKND